MTRLVTGVSKETSEAGKPCHEVQSLDRGLGTSAWLTDISRQNKEVIVGQGTVLIGVKERINVKTVAGGVVLFQDLQGLCVVLELGLHGPSQ